MLAEWVIAAKPPAMRRFLALLLIPSLALVPGACRPDSHGAVNVVVIGDEPRIADPAKGPLNLSEAVLLDSVGQGLVRFDASGNIVGGLAERWNVSDDGLSYIFRIASTQWSDGRKVTAQQVAKILKRAIAAGSKNPIKDTLGAVDDIVAMTDRVIEIRLTGPRPNLLALLAQPNLAIVRNGLGTGPFAAAADSKQGEVRLTRSIVAGEDEPSQKEEVVLRGAPVRAAVQSFLAGKSDLVIGGTFADLPYLKQVKIARGVLEFDPASGLFGLAPARAGGGFDDPEARRLLSQAIDRTLFIGALGVPNLAPRATVLEPGLDGSLPFAVPAWLGTPLADRLPALRSDADRIFGKEKPAIRVALPDGPGADLLLAALARSWGALGFTVERAANDRDADFRLVDEVAPSSSPAWFLRAFHCGAAAVCDPDTDKLLDAARAALIPPQRYALLQQAAARIDDAQLFLPIAAPVRWSLVGRRVQGFSGNRFAVHTLTDLESRPGTGD